MKNHRILFLLSLICGFSAVHTGCSTATVTALTPLPEVPEYVRVPHPAGYEMSDLRAALLSPLAPKGLMGEFADTCDEDYKKLSTLSVSKEEKRLGAVELINHDPERMHWCFYSKLLKLNDFLSGDSTWSLKQKSMLETFDFLSPVANAFLETYNDTRYMRWASTFYTKTSEWVFFRKVISTPDNTLIMVNGQHSDLEPWVPVKGNEIKTNSVFEKYGIELGTSVPKSRAPASVKP